MATSAGGLCLTATAQLLRAGLETVTEQVATIAKRSTIGGLNITLFDYQIFHIKSGISAIFLYYNFEKKGNNILTNFLIFCVLQTQTVI